MISVVRLWNTLMQSAKTGTAGYQTADEFNRDLASVQTSLMSLLASSYAKSLGVKELLSPFVKPYTANTSSAGVLTRPADYFQIADASVAGYPASQIEVNERAMLRFVPSRRPSVANNIYAYYLEDDNIQFMPEETLAVDMIYIRVPDEAELALTPVSEANRDYVVPTAVSELEWGERAFNIILCMMLQKLGLELKEQLQLEYSSIGLQSEISKI